MGITMWFLVFSLIGSQPLSANGETDVTSCSEFSTYHSLSKITVAPMLSKTILEWPFQEKMPANSTDPDPDSSKTVVATHQLAQHSREQFDNFKTWGYNIEVAYHYLATMWLDRDIWIGLDFGFFFNENKGDLNLIFFPSGETVSGKIGSRGMYITPSLKWFVWGQRGSRRLYLGAGVGYYLLDFAEQYPFGEGGEIFEESTIGGYLSAGVRFPISKNRPESAAIILESKVNFADFGELAPGTGDIKGPIYLFQLGITF
jgi:hypothetical protein